jgi:hypothetical protein
VAVLPVGGVGASVLEFQAVLDDPLAGRSQSQSPAVCYVDEVALLLPEVRGETRIPPSPLGG